MCGHNFRRQINVNVVHRRIGLAKSVIYTVSMARLELISTDKTASTELSERAKDKAAVYRDLEDLMITCIRTPLQCALTQ
jgi:hypothetical protein